MAGSETEEHGGKECQADGEGEDPSVDLKVGAQLAEGKLEQL